MTIGIAAQLAGVMQELGTAVTIETITRVEDQDAGTSTESSSTTLVKGAFENVSQHLVDGTVIRAGDMLVTILGPDLPGGPKIDSMRLIALGQRWTVLAFETFPDGDEIAAYRLRVRGA